MLRFLTAGESHGPKLTAIVEGLPAGLDLTAEFINRELARRQHGYGRGGRMAIERDQVEITSGVRFGKTLGSPVTLEIRNRDWVNWEKEMAVEPEAAGEYPSPCGQWPGLVTKPRPGHADLTGVLKYQHPDVRNVLERASARETTARVAVGAVAKVLLSVFGISVFSQVLAIGGVKAEKVGGLEEIDVIENSPLRCADSRAEKAMMARLDELKSSGDSAGGTFRVDVVGVPPGLGSYAAWDRRLDARLCGAVMSIPGIKGVEIGLGFAAAHLPGSLVHDEIVLPQGKDRKNHSFLRETNRAGGIEGGMSNGEPIWLVAAMKPIPTLYKPLRSIDLRSGKPWQATVERSDVCAVPAAAVVAEAMVAWVIAVAMVEKFGGDSISEMSANVKAYMKQVESMLRWDE